MRAESLKNRISAKMPAAAPRETSKFASGEQFDRGVCKLIDRRIRIVVTLLESNSDKQIEVAKIARLVNLSSSRLAHLFKSEMDLSMQQYLKQLRLAKAKRELETSFLSVKEISAAAGFSSVARFVACFKSSVGFTPGQYRKQLSNTAYHDAERSR